MPATARRPLRPCCPRAGLSDDELAVYRAQPAWQARVDATARITREVRAIPEATFDPDWAARVTAPTLLVTGADSRDPSTVDIETVAAALSDARIAVLDGQQQFADVLAPQTFAETAARSPARAAVTIGRSTDACRRSGSRP